jgi:hypothetical protein
VPNFESWSFNSLAGHHPGARLHDEAAARLACDCRDDGFDLSRVVDRRCDGFHADRRRRSFEVLEKALRIGRRGLNKSITRTVRGAISMSNSSHLLMIVSGMLLNPVAL